jgi:hypothetical protein
MPRHPRSGLPAPKRHLAAELRRDHRRRDMRETHDNFFKKIIYSANQIMYCAFEGSRRNGFAAAGLEETTPTFC